MAEYRAYAVGEDGNFVSSRPFVGSSDELAITWANRLVDSHEIELWSGERFVARLETDTSKKLSG
jgi:hypothetical protein